MQLVSFWSDHGGDGSIINALYIQGSSRIRDNWQDSSLITYL